MIKPTVMGLTAGLAMGLSQIGYAEAPERLFLQKLSTHSVVVKWRGKASQSKGVSKVCFSANLSDSATVGKLNRKEPKQASPKCVKAEITEGNHREATLSGLSPDTTYYYSVHGAVKPDQYFRTAPEFNTPPSNDGNTHILIVGDSGTITDGISDDHPDGEYPGEAQAVLDGYYTYAAANGGEAVDLFLALGDNAYETGTDDEWQESFFELYTNILMSAQTLPTIGNHEMGAGTLELPLCILLGLQGRPCPPGIDFPGPLVSVPFPGASTSSDPLSYDGNGDFIPDDTGFPYLNIFSLPAAGESGGVASGTEQYYSVDYGNVHVVSLDTQLSARDDDSREVMKNWLMSDLSANTLDWTIVIFHHPPYTKGTNHDSDDADVGLLGVVIDLPERDMREEFTPIFEDHGVDVVYSGHSHSYERSYYLSGHTGTSDTFVAETHAEMAGDHPASGRPSDGETYHQQSPTSGGLDDRVVYTVAGSSGKANKGGDSFGITGDDEWLRHAAHVEQPLSDTKCDYEEGCRPGLRGLGVKGSVVIDADDDSLRARFVDINGDVLDEFIINR